MRPGVQRVVHQVEGGVEGRLPHLPAEGGDPLEHRLPGERLADGKEETLGARGREEHRQLPLRRLHDGLAALHPRHDARDDRVELGAGGDRGRRDVVVRHQHVVALHPRHVGAHRAPRCSCRRRSGRRSWRRSSPRPSGPPRRRPASRRARAARRRAGPARRERRHPARRRRRPNGADRLESATARATRASHGSPCSGAREGARLTTSSRASLPARSVVPAKPTRPPLTRRRLRPVSRRRALSFSLPLSNRRVSCDSLRMRASAPSRGAPDAVEDVCSRAIVTPPPRLPDEQLAEPHVRRPLGHREGELAPLPAPAPPSGSTGNRRRGRRWL